MDDYMKSNLPRPMADPCEFCPRQDRCQSAETYKCDLFRVMFIQSWDNVVSFLKEQLGMKKEA